MDIGPVSASALEALAALWRDSALSMDGGAPMVDAADRLRGRLCAGMANGWRVDVAEMAGRPVGFVAVIAADRVLSQLFVIPDRQGQGIGAALFAHARRLLPDGFLLRTPATNLAGQRFYLRHGMHVVGPGAHPVTGAPVLWLRWSPPDGRA